MLSTKSVKKADSPTDEGKTVVGAIHNAPASDPALEHSPLGPSSGKRWMTCTGSVKRTAGMPDVSSSYAAEGTAAHTLSEWVREQGKKAKTFIGQSIKAKGEEHEVTAEMAEAVQDFCDYCDEMPGDPFYEERVHYTAWVPDGWGTADDIRIDDKTATCYVTDLKYGKGVQVFVRKDPQLKLYALGTFQDLGHLYDIKKFVLTIHQPRLKHVDKMELSVRDLLIWARDVVAVQAQEAMGPDAVFVAGEHCQFCKAKSDCETRNEAMQEMYLNDLDGPEEVPGHVLAEILERVALMKAWCADMEARAVKDLQALIPVGDWKLVAGRGSRNWKDAKEAEKKLRSVRKLKVADLFTKKFVSPAQAEKLLGKKHPALKDMIKVSQGKPTLAPGDDPRPSFQVKAEDEFEDLDGVQSKDGQEA